MQEKFATFDLADWARVTERMMSGYIRDQTGAVAQKLRAKIPTECAIGIRPRWVRGWGRA